MAVWLRPAEIVLPRRAGGRARRFGLPAMLAALIAAAPETALAANTGTVEALIGCRAYAYEQNANFYSGVCLGTVSSVLHMSFAAPLRPALRICAPARETYAQAVRVVTQWVEDHPEKQDQSFADLAVLAMQATWPCER
jgi:hypothetical protein